jgi:hypothetical protein
MSREIMQQALDLLKSAHVSTALIWDRSDCVNALEAALAKPEQEPVAQIRIGKNGYWIEARSVKSLPDGLHDLYATPPRKPWVGLTDKDMQILVDQARKVPTEIPCQDHNERLLTLADAKLKELNT